MKEIEEGSNKVRYMHVQTGYGFQLFDEAVPVSLVRKTSMSE